MQITGAVGDQTLYAEGLVPLTIGITGHRDLVDSEEPAIRAQVAEFFTGLRTRFPDRPIQLLSPLAEGADRLVAEVALELGLRLTVPLPMPRELYVDDFETQESRDHFSYLCDRAEAVLELPIGGDRSPDELREPGDNRNWQYAQLGVFLCAHSHILLALWDGKQTEDVGGTAQVIRFHHHDVMAGYAPSQEINRQLLVDDDSDLVYHIVVSRARPGGRPAGGLRVLSTTWLTTDAVSPRTTDLPSNYANIFEKTSEFNREARKNFHRISEECYPLIDSDSEDQLPDEAFRINLFFCVADWLAIHYQQRVLTALRITHSLAFIMGVMFLLYSDFEARQPFMQVFFGCFAVAFIVHTVAARGKWHSKYLEYRALAEGLRVQFYWAVAGVRSEMSTKYSHDNFLQKQDPDLGWIRNVMRVAGIGCDVKPNLDPAGLAFVMEEWVGSDDGGGQLRYFRTKAGQFITRDRQLGSLSKLMGTTVTALVVAAALVTTDEIRNSLFVALGTLLLIYSVRQAYLHRVGEKDLIKQYEFMYSMFRNAKQRLDSASDASEKRKILRVLGESALDEHAEWTFVHRERPPDPGGVWRMES